MPAFAVSALSDCTANSMAYQPTGPSSLILAHSARSLPIRLPHCATGFKSLALNISRDGTPFLMHALPWFRALLADALPSVPDGALPALPLNISGSGVYDDPWSLPLSTGATASIDALVWLESGEGDLTTPPPAWAMPLSLPAIHGTTDFSSLLTQAASLANYVPALRNALSAADDSTLATSLTQLADTSFLYRWRGAFRLTSACLTGWTAGTTLTSPHPSQPSDPQAISQILTQIDSWAGGASSQRTVVLLGPAFSDHTIWNTLLASGALHGVTDPAATFNLRQANVDPTTISLNSIGNVAWDYYSADLKDDGSGNVTSQVTQIGNIVTRLQQLRPGVKVTLVAHSTSGIASRLYTSANATNVQGLITVGTPHLGAGLPFLTDESMANALRILQSVIPTAASSDQNISALQHIFSALDGYLPPAVAGACLRRTHIPSHPSIQPSPPD